MDREGMAATLRENCDPEGKTSPPEGRGWREPLPARFPRARAGRSPWFRPPGRRGGPDSRLTSSSGAKPAAQLVSSASGRAAAAMAPAPRPFRRAATTARGGGGGGAGKDRAESGLGPGWMRCSPLPPWGGWCGPAGASRCRVRRCRHGRSGAGAGGWVRTAPAAAPPSRPGLCCPGRGTGAPRGIPQHPGSVRRCC